MTSSDERQLHASSVPTGQRRTLSVTVRDGAPPPRLLFIEKYSGEGTGWLGRFTSFRAEALLDGDPSPLVAAIADLADAGKLDRPPMGARERVADLLEAAGLVVRRESTIPWVHLGRRATLHIEPDGRVAGITFTERIADEARFRVVASYDDLDAIATHLAASSGVDAPPADRIGRFIALFEAFAGDDVDADRVQEMLQAAGVESERQDERRYRLLKAGREHTDCIFTLTLLVSAIDDKISFTEFYDYLPRSGDSGREYGYSAVAPHAALPQLAAHFAARLGLAVGEDADALAACFRELVERGELGDHQAIEGCRDLVGAWFTEAGVAWRPDHWVWFNSD